MPFDSLDTILAFAIDKEAEAAKFYTELAGRMTRPEMREVFQSFAREEEGHRQKLLGVREGRQLTPVGEPIPDLRIADYAVGGPAAPDMAYADALILAMKAEKAAFRLYTDLAAAVADPALRRTLEALAQEEARHKLRFELEYDELTRRGDN